MKLNKKICYFSMQVYEYFGLNAIVIIFYA